MRKQHMIIKEYNDFSEIPQKYRRSLAQMHFRYKGTMVGAFHDKENVTEIVILVDHYDVPVGWYIIWNEEAMFWVKTRFRGNGYGKMLTSHFFSFAQKNTHRNFQVFDAICEIRGRFYSHVKNVW